MDEPYVPGPSFRQQLLSCVKDCSACLVFTNALYLVGHNRILTEGYTESEWIDSVRYLEKAHIESGKCPYHKKKRTHEGNGKHMGPWAFTITKSDKDPLTVGDMLAAVRKIMAQKTAPVVKYAWYYEDKGRDVNGDPIHPHIHGMYETVTGGRVPARQFERAWNIWDENKPMGSGFRGGYHRPVKHNEAYTDYIGKDGGMSESKGHEMTE